MKIQVTQNQILGLFIGSGHHLWVAVIKVVAGPSSWIIYRGNSGFGYGTTAVLTTDVCEMMCM